MPKLARGRKPLSQSYAKGQRVAARQRRTKQMRSIAQALLMLRPMMSTPLRDKQPVQHHHHHLQQLKVLSG
jgi:hypothetical protein